MKFKNEGVVVKKLRLRHDISQNKLASLIGYESGQFISNAERGISSLPASKLALFFGEKELSLILQARLDDECESFWKDVDGAKK